MGVVAPLIYCSFLISSLYFAGCWWIRSFMAIIFRNSCTSILLLPLFLCKWSCSYRSHVHSILIRCQCTRYSTILGSVGALIPLEPYGWHYTLRNWISPCILRSKLCPPREMVGIWVCMFCRQPSYLAWRWRDLVEGHWLMVELLVKMTASDLQQLTIPATSSPPMILTLTLI